ncbi:unnamed protein product [Thlaspi arvense]|uniref:Uncharacterized protein n=1 Tax=Thlaspi arvense TaxID=13288 RepID=A0AAU9R787_THLAR|nr:unnamed protein product [Thlaspi arvense]
MQFNQLLVHCFSLTQTPKLQQSSSGAVPGGVASDSRYCLHSTDREIQQVERGVVEDEDGEGIYGTDALSISAWYGRGHENRDLWLMLMFLVLALAMRMPCLYSKCSESLNGDGVLYTSLYVESIESIEMKMNEKLSVIKLLKRAAKLLFGNIKLAFFLLLCSLPLFCFLIFFELSLQTTVSLTYQFLSKQLSFEEDLSGNDLFLQTTVSLNYQFLSQQHSFWEDLSENHLILWLIQTSLLYFLPYTFLDLLTTTTIVAASSIVYTSEKEPMRLTDLVRRSFEICQTRVRGCLITSLYVLLLSTSVFIFFFLFFLLLFFGFFSNWTKQLIIAPLLHQHQSFLDQAPVLIYAMVVLVQGTLFMYLTGKFFKWSAGWNMGLVVSVVEEDGEDGQGIYGSDALSLSALYRRGHEKRDLWMMLVFLVFSLAARIPCVYSKCNLYSSGNRVLYTGIYVGFLCVGNVLKWLACVVCYHNCKTRFLRKKADVEQQAKPPAT